MDRDIVPRRGTSEALYVFMFHVTFTCHTYGFAYFDVIHGLLIGRLHDIYVPFLSYKGK
jgi:hypothetical protein